MVRAVLFDLDGVLVESFDVWLEVVRDAVREIGDGREITRAEFLAGWGQSVAADVERWFPGATVAEVGAYYEAHFLEHAGRLKVDPEAAPLVSWLRARGLGLAVVTNTPGALARRILARAGVEIGAVVGSTDVPRGKPAPDSIVRALELLGLSARSALMVGDTVNDRHAADAAGVRFVGLRVACDTRIEQLGDLRVLLADPE